MAEALKNNLRSFIDEGGGYVGFCAGGFLATAMIADRGVQGLGILPGTNALFEWNEDAAILPTQWKDGAHDLYWEGGPYFKLDLTQAADAAAEVMGTYADGSIASLRAHYGQGRVYVTGFHPEAPEFWRTAYRLTDADGLDFGVAVKMVHWAIFASSNN
jgi:glutamine amidotransferase-like uncharacterized protein